MDPWVQQTPSKIVSLLISGKGKVLKHQKAAPTGNRIQGKCLEGIYVTTTPLALQTCNFDAISQKHRIIYIHLL